MQNTQTNQSAQPSKPKTKCGQKTEKLLNNIFEPLDIIGQRIMGELWRTLYLTVQDALSLSLILQIPGIIGLFILGKDFSGFDVCLQEHFLSPAFYACFIIVSSTFFLWIILAGRMIGRFLEDFKNLWNKKGGSGYGSGQP